MNIRMGRLVDRVYRLSPALDGGEDRVGGFGRDERLGFVVGLGDEAVDGGLQFDDRGRRRA